MASTTRVTNRQEVLEKLKAAQNDLETQLKNEKNTVQINRVDVDNAYLLFSEAETPVEETMRSLALYRRLSTSSAMAADSIKSLQTAISKYSGVMTDLRDRVSSAAQQVQNVYSSVSAYSSAVGSMNQLVLDEYGDSKEKYSEYRRSHRVLESKETALDSAEHARIELLELTAQADGLQTITTALEAAAEKSVAKSDNLHDGYQQLLNNTTNELTAAINTELNDLNQVVIAVDTWTEGEEKEDALEQSIELVKEEKRRVD